MNTLRLVRGMLRCAAGALLFCVALGPAATQAQPPNYGHDFVTVDAPHNRRPNQQEAWPFYPPYVGPNFTPPGRVNHRYRITRTEVSVRQWYDFVVAYAPYWEGSPSDPDLTSDWIRYRQGSYVIEPGAENYSANMSWHNAARYCNWLTNNKRPERSAFEDGAYDAVTFRLDPNGWPMDQLAHHVGAAFWIPTWDEWLKAAFYDPDRYGPGQEGYWLYPNSSNTPLRPGYPSQGGETNAGIPGLFSGEFDVGSYPTVQSPWGLLDISGGAREWTESPYDPMFARRRFLLGTAVGTLGSETGDRIYNYATLSPWHNGGGLRLASLVPAPGAATVVLIALASTQRRRRLR